MDATTTAPRRSNSEWLTQLRDSSLTDSALGDLRTFLHRTLARAIGTRGDVDECDLEDLTQEALVRVHQGLEGFRGDSRFTTWAAAVAIRVALTALRRHRFRVCPLEHLEMGLVRPATGARAERIEPGASLDRSTLIAALNRAIEEDLTERQRIAVRSRLAGEPSASLAERLGSNPNALYKLQHDARRRLKGALERRGFGEKEVREWLLQSS